MEKVKEERRIYICYFNYGPYEGCSIPVAVFSTQKAAEQYCKNNYEAEWEVLVLDKE